MKFSLRREGSGRSVLTNESALKQVTRGLGLVQLHLNQVNGRIQIIICRQLTYKEFFPFWLVFAKETKTLVFSGSQKKTKKKEIENENGKITSSLAHVAKLT